MSDWLSGYQGNQRPIPLISLLMKRATCWSLGQVCKVSHVSKAGAVRQGIYREQEDSCLGWPDHTDRKPCWSGSVFSQV